MELDAFAQLEGVAEPVDRGVDALGEQRADTRVFPVGDEPLDDVQYHGIRVVVAVNAWIGAADVGPVPWRMELLNRADLVDAEEQQRVRDWLASVASKTPRFETTQASVPMPLLSDSALSLDSHARANAGVDASEVSNRATVRAGRHEREHDHNHEHNGGHDHDHGDLFETWSCQPAREFSARALRALLRDMPAGVLRLKGVLRTDEHDWAELQFAGRHGSLRKALAAPASGAAVVAIGLRHQLPTQALSAALEAASSDVA